jgi:hypothetical protein
LWIRQKKGFVGLCWTSLVAAQFVYAIGSGFVGLCWTSLVAAQFVYAIGSGFVGFDMLL